MALPAGRVGVTPDSVDANGKVITPDPLPEHAAEDAGKKLTVSDDGGLEWAESESELPEYSAEDAGKQLSVNGDGDGLEWKAPEGGSVDIIDSTEVELPFKIDGAQLYAMKKVYTSAGAWQAITLPSAIENRKIFTIVGHYKTSSTIYPLTYIRDSTSWGISWGSGTSIDMKGPSNASAVLIFIYTK